MISYRGREGKRGRGLKMARNVERLYKEGKCRDCSVVVTRMDFAKILGKFTKVKIQYESSSSPKKQKTLLNNNIVNAKSVATPITNTRLKNNENGMVQFHRKAYNPHPAKDLINTRRNTQVKNASPTVRQVSNNVLKEINVSKNTNFVKNRSITYSNIRSNGKHYTIVFNDPTSKDNNNSINNCELTLSDLLPKVNNLVLPTSEWCIDYFPKTDEPKNDRVYDRIAAELEDLMYSDKPVNKSDQSKPPAPEVKVDEFPSIMDILNDNATPESNSVTKDQNVSLDFKDNLESNDVEAMLLGKTNNNKVETPMDIDNTEVNKLIDDVAQLNTDSAIKDPQSTTEFENPHSPSILDEALQKGIEEHLPNPPLEGKSISENGDSVEKNVTNNQNSNDITSKNDVQSNMTYFPPTLKFEDVTHVIFKKVIDGKCIKSVTCPKNLKYSIELEDKSVEFLGAPKYITNLDDLQVLLQIVNESNLTSLYVLY